MSRWCLAASRQDAALNKAIWTNAASRRGVNSVTRHSYAYVLFSGEANTVRLRQWYDKCGSSTITPSAMELCATSVATVMEELLGGIKRNNTQSKR